jgi:hypothetical protein
LLEEAGTMSSEENIFDERRKQEKENGDDYEPYEAHASHHPAHLVVHHNFDL